MSSVQEFTVPEAAAAELSRYDRFGLPIRIVLQLCVHAIGLHILIMTHVRMRGTFMKVGQSLLVRKQLEMEKQLKEKMIQSVSNIFEIDCYFTYNIKTYSVLSLP